MELQQYNTKETKSRAFLYGDAVKLTFYVHHNTLLMTEEIYFFIMASMRKMRMSIPLSYTLEYFEQILRQEVVGKAISNAFVHFVFYRIGEKKANVSSPVEMVFYIEEKDILEIQKPIELDIIKEISVNVNLLSNIRVHCPENIYAEIYATENDLDDVILLNPNKRIARSIYGNLLFLEDNRIKIPKMTEGAYISPLMENFVTFVHKNALAQIVESEIIAFESQKSEEILMISDERGFFPVSKIRNKEFGFSRFSEMIDLWQKNMKISF